MIGVIPNPTASFQIGKPIEEVVKAIEEMYLFSSKYKLFKANPVLNQCTYEASEFLSMGVYIDINSFSIAEGRTEVKIEIRRKIGSFDKSHEVSLANQHLTDVRELISESISAGAEARKTKIDAATEEVIKKEEAQREKIEEIRRKNAEEKQNNPVAYYTKTVLINIFSLGIVALVIWLLYKFFTR